MRNLVTVIVLVSFTILGFNSCKKYDEGPLISFVTKKERISNIWKVDYVEDNGFEQQGFPYKLSQFEEAQLTITLDKNGKAKVNKSGDDGNVVVYEGTWKFSGNNENLEWAWNEEIPGFVQIFNTTSVYRIRQLREDRLHLTSMDDRFRLHFTPR